MSLFSDKELLGYLRGLDAVLVALGSNQIYGIFTRDYSEAMDIEGYQPVLVCRTSDVSGVSHGATVTVSTVAYAVRSIQPRDDGLTRLVLEKDET